MKVKLKELRYFNNRRCYPGDILEWPYEKLGRGMVVVEEVEKPEPRAAVGPERAPMALSEGLNVQATPPAPVKRGRPRKSDEGVL